METELADGHTETHGADPASEPAASHHRLAPPAGPEGATPETSIDRVDRLLDDVELALTRLDDGTYGQCVTCGAAIEDARLAAEPTIRTCAACGAVPVAGPAVSTTVAGPVAAQAVTAMVPDGEPEPEVGPVGPPADPPSGPPAD
jgi:RNA polymerase-binding transcription factor DksA